MHCSNGFLQICAPQRKVLWFLLHVILCCLFLSIIQFLRDNKTEKLEMEVCECVWFDFRWYDRRKSSIKYQESNVHWHLVHCFGEYNIIKTKTYLQRNTWFKQPTIPHPTPGSAWPSCCPGFPKVRLGSLQMLANGLNGWWPNYDISPT